MNLAITQEIMNKWREVRGTMMNFYKNAASGYFTFLKLSKSKDFDDVKITCTLRLLRLLVRFGDDLKDVFVNGLKETPTQPW